MVKSTISSESGGDTGTPLHNVESDNDGFRFAAVCLIQATRIPARHQKLVRAELKGVLVNQQHATVFEPNIATLEDVF